MLLYTQKISGKSHIGNHCCFCGVEIDSEKAGDERSRLGDSQELRKFNFHFPLFCTVLIFFQHEDILPL